MHRRRLTYAILALCLCVWPVAAHGQQETATIVGTVIDGTGAIVPGATVMVTNVQTNISLTTQTDDRGAYAVASLRPGEYSLTVELSGFQKTIRTGVILQVAQVARIDLTLQTGQLTETVEVVGNSPILETQTSSRGAVIDEKQIVELPLNGRDYNQLALLSPGVLPGTPRLASVNFKGVLNVNGNRTFNNVFLLDGVDNISYSNSFRGENVQLVQPSIEALQEFKIQTNAYSAEFGRSSGAVVNAVIKSGTNTLRGSVYEFLRNDSLDANNFFSNALGAPKPKRERNQFGVAAGGPLVRNKTFWFGDYEGLRDEEGIPRVRQVPTAAEKAGLFSTAVVDPFAAGRPQFSRNPAGQWVIPSIRWDPVGAAIVALIPDPNVPNSTIYASTPVTDTRQDQFDVRIDHQFTANVSTFGRYSFVDTLTFRPAPLPGLAEGSFNDAFGANDNRSQGLALGVTWVASSNLVGDIRFGYSRGDYYTNPPNFGIDGAAAVGLRNVPSDPSIVGGVPKVNIQGFDAVGRHTSTPQFQTPRSWNPRATFSWNRGQHFIKFGGEFLHVQTRINDLNATIGRMNFENRFTNRAVGDLLLGLPSQLALTSYTVMDQGQDMQFYFVQDDYRLTSKLTANIGLRYEYATPPQEKDNQFGNFDPATGTMVFATDGDTYERSLIRPDRNNFAPRIGFAYTPVERWVIRGGYGVFYTHTVRQGREGLLGFNPPYLVDNLLQTGVTGAAAIASAAPFRLVNGYPSGLLDPNSLSPTVLRRGQDPDQRTPYIQQYNIGAQYRAHAGRRPRRRVRRQQGDEAERLPESEPARGHHQRRRLAGGGRAAVPGLRRHPVDGEPGRLELQVASGAAGEAVLEGPVGERRLHVGRGAVGRARSHLDERRRGRRGHGRLPRAAGRQQPPRGERAVGVRHRASLRRQLHLGAAVRPRPRHRQRLGPRDGPRVRRLAADGDPRHSERPGADGDAQRGDGREPGRRAPRAAESRRRSRAAFVRAHDRPLVQHERLRCVQPRAAGVRKRGCGHHARAEHDELRLLAVEELPGRRSAIAPVPDRAVQRVQQRELRSAQHRARLERLRSNPHGRCRADHAVRVEVLLLTPKRGQPPFYDL